MKYIVYLQQIYDLFKLSSQTITEPKVQAVNNLESSEQVSFLPPLNVASLTTHLCLLPFPIYFFFFCFSCSPTFSGSLFENAVSLKFSCNFSYRLLLLPSRFSLLFVFSLTVQTFIRTAS